MCLVHMYRPLQLAKPAHVHWYASPLMLHATPMPVLVPVASMVVFAPVAPMHSDAVAFAPVRFHLLVCHSTRTPWLPTSCHRPGATLYHTAPLRLYPRTSCSRPLRTTDPDPRSTCHHHTAALVQAPACMHPSNLTSVLTATPPQELQNEVHRERAAAAKAAAASPVQQVWRSVIPPLRPPGVGGAPQAPPPAGAPSWLPRAQPGGLVDRFVKGLAAAFSPEGLKTYILPAVAAGVLTWVLLPRQPCATPHSPSALRPAPSQVRPSAFHQP